MRRLEEDAITEDLVARCDLHCATEKRRGKKCQHGRTQFEEPKPARRRHPAWKRLLFWPFGPVYRQPKGSQGILPFEGGDDEPT